MHISFLIFYIPLILLFSCGQKEKNSDSQGTRSPPPPVCGEAAENVIMALKQSSANLDNSLTQKANLNCVSKDGMSPLNTAVVLGGEANLKKILENGAEPNFKNALGETALHQAVKSRKKYLMGSLFDHYENEDKGKDKGKNLGDIGDDSGKTPLHLAIQLGDMEATRFLLQKGASFESVDRQKWTPLHFAANEANLDMIKYLIGLGADIEAKNSLGHTPFFTCQRSSKIKSYSVCQYLKPPEP